MANEQGRSLSELLGEVRFVYRTRIDFTKTDPKSLREIARRVTNAAFRFNLLVIAEFGGKSGRERAPGLVDQVVAAAFQSFGGVDPHPHPFQKAAMLVRGITAGHPFSDANKRTGFLTAMYYLEQVGYAEPDSLPMDEVVELCLKVSAGEVREVDEIAATLAHFWGRPFP